ncbi:MAG: hypothetical protein HONBIEJF_01585 [Fimbriimonadaceae bacterium]|nr:hypothetical protein [Fimbriimonadaceae bacterium]
MKHSNWLVATFACSIVGTVAFVLPRAMAGESSGPADSIAGASIVASGGRGAGSEPIMLVATKETASYPTGGSSSPATFEAVYSDSMTVEVKALAPIGGSGTAPTLTVLASAKNASDDYKQTNVSISVQEGAAAGWVSEVVFLFKESGVIKKIYSTKIATN